MAQPTLTATGVEHADGSTLTGWDSPAELGSVIMAWGVTTDFFIEGADALGMEQKTGTGVKGIRFNLASTTDFTVTNRKLQILVWITSVAIVDTLAAGGVRIYAHDGTDYAFWYVGGNDVSWVGNGWKLISIDLNTTPDFDNATFDPSSVDYVGIAVNWTGVLGRADGVAVDLVRHIDLLEAKGGTLRFIDGTNGIDLNENGASADTIDRNDGGDFAADGFEVGDILEIRGSATAANDGRYALTAVAATLLTLSIGDLTADDIANTTLDIECEFTLQDIINEDQVNNSFWYGTVVKGDTGSFEINGNLVIGDVSGSDFTSFRSENEVIVFPDNNLSAGMNEISCAEDTGETRIKFGSASGTGDAKVGFGGSTFYSAPEVYLPVYGIDFSTSITECLIFGSVFINAEDGITLSASATDNEWINNTVASSGEVNSDNAIVRNCFFNATASPSTASAFLWVTNTDITNSFFNGNVGTDISAIRHTDGTTRTYTNLKFAGNTYDVFLNHASANLTINKSGTSDPTTSRSSGSGSVTFVGTKSITINVEDKADPPIAIQNATVTVYKRTDPGILSGAGNAAGDADFVCSASLPTDQAASGWFTVVDVSEQNKFAQLQSYRYASFSGTTFTLLTEETGSATAGSSGSQNLESTSEDFVAGDYEDGDTIRNTIDGSYATIIRIIDADNIETTPLQGGSDNTWQDTDTFSVHRLGKAYTDSEDKVQFPLLHIPKTTAGGVATGSINLGSAIDIIYNARRSSPEYSPIYLEGEGSGNMSDDFEGTLGLAEDTVAT